MRSMVEGAATGTEFWAAPSTAYGGPPPRVRGRGSPTE